jgi:hypothetical protein
MSMFMVGSVAWNVGDILDGNEAEQEIAVVGAALGDYVDVSSSLNVLDLVLSAAVTEADVVTVSFANNTGGTVDALTPTVRVRVTSRVALGQA